MKTKEVITHHRQELRLIVADPMVGTGERMLSHGRLLRLFQSTVTAMFTHALSLIHISSCKISPACSFKMPTVSAFSCAFISVIIQYHSMHFLMISGVVAVLFHVGCPLQGMTVTYIYSPCQTRLHSPRTPGGNGESSQRASQELSLIHI